MMIHEMIYSPGDFVLFELPDNKGKSLGQTLLLKNASTQFNFNPVPGIMRIERLWTNNENIKMMHGNIYLRPYETYHLQTRKFMEQEVFRSEQHQAEPLEKIRGKCFVMNVRDYFKIRPEGFADKDVFVCESRYHSKSRNFIKIKNWGATNSVKLVTRDQPLEVKRVQSVFRERVEKHKEELSELSMQEALVEKEKPVSFFALFDFYRIFLYIFLFLERCCVR
jgi:protein polybromo-1